MEDQKWKREIRNMPSMRNHRREGRCRNRHWVWHILIPGPISMHWFLTAEDATKGYYVYRVPLCAGSVEISRNEVSPDGSKGRLPSTFPSIFLIPSAVGCSNVPAEFFLICRYGGADPVSATLKAFFSGFTFLVLPIPFLSPLLQPITCDLKSDQCSIPVSGNSTLFHLTPTQLSTLSPRRCHTSFL
jgi:hypothetical protein